MDTFLLKKFVAGLLFPLSLSVELLILGLLLLLLTKKKMLGKILLVLGTMLIILASNTLLSHALLTPLERRYPALLEVPEMRVGGPIGWVVVLGGGNTNDRTIPPANRISGSSLTRLVEGISLYRQAQGSRLILSGGPVYGSVSNAVAMADVAKSLGVPDKDIVIEDRSRETETEVDEIKPIVGNDRFILVTSASHMPRAMGLFEKAGMSPIPAPTDFSGDELGQFSPSMVYPNARALLQSERVVYEHLGRLWAWVRGKT